MIFVVSQYAIGCTCHNESILIGLFRQRQFADERKCLFESADVRGGGTGDEPQRTSAWEATDERLGRNQIFWQFFSINEPTFLCLYQRHAEH